MNKPVGDVAQALIDIYEQTFGGKNRGRFKISRSNLRRLSGRKRLEDTTIEKIADAAYDKGLIVVDLGDYFAVVEEGVMRNYRPVPKSILSVAIESCSELEEADDDD